ncbi:otogelin isoform X1 [Hemibagrus wyckioides]|uniref:otogelin isoform X1 n=1 Tax=Hemibagrus wyckioides TaxID=337641 RepID=UPI00266DAAEA|nr:otogelin isoform X1 [Hemibagrus wyckioides]
MDPNSNLIQKGLFYFLLVCVCLVHQVCISWAVESVNLTHQHDPENRSSGIMLAKWETRSHAEQQVQLNSTSSEQREAWAARRSRGTIDPCVVLCLHGDHCLYPGSCNCSSYHVTGSHCQTVPNTGLEREMACRSWGQYSYETFDGLYYYFPGKCSYTLVKDCEDSTTSGVFIQVHNDPDCNSNPYSCRRSVSLFLPWEGEIRLQGFNVTFKGQSLQLPHNIHDIELERISDYILVSQHQIFMLAWQGHSSSIYIKMNPEFVGRTCGLCGNFNADVQDDLKTSYGVFTDNLSMFGNSWMEEEPQQLTCPMVPSFYPFPCSTQDPHDLLKVAEVCTSLLEDPFKSCHEFVSPYSYMASCSNDICLSGSSGDMVCNVLTEYTRACAHAGHPLHNWRAHFPLCGIECPAELIYRECITCCPVHCNTEHICIDNKLQCLDGCYCPDGLIYEDGICVKPSDCPCEHRGMLYPSGHTIQEECNNCTCVGGVWNCTEHSCPGECSVTGDMYFQSFDGQVYTFQATCQYVLAKSRNPGGFIVTIQNSPCGPNLDGACIQSVNLVLNEDPRTEVTISHSGEVYMASQIRVSLPYSDEMFQIQELSSMFVQLKTVQGLRLQYNWKEFRLYLQLGELWRDNTVGLCGTFNGNIQDDFLAPSGMIESSPNLFGNAWRLPSACLPRPSLPQLDPCDTHQQAASYAVEKCDILTQEVFAVCHEHVSPMAFQLQCRADVCRCGTPCLCSALAHYIRTCRKHNIIIEFRSHVPECAVTCPPTMEYGVCVSSCERHCLSLSLPKVCGDECEEGCVCPQGTYYSMHTQTCVKRSECPCSFLGADYSPGDVILTSSDIQICQDGKFVSQSIITDKFCPPGQVYEDCGNMVQGLSARKGLACVHTCESYLLNLTCSSHEPCVPGCICPLGLLKHGDECIEPVSCPCLWKGKEYYPGDRVSSPCHQCVCQHGLFQCNFHPCASMCTVYGDRHYRTFDGLLFDYIGDCKVHLIKSSTDVTLSVTAENVDCFESGVICRKTLFISVGQSIIVFDDESGKPNPSSVIDRQNVYILNAGYFTIIHLKQYEISVLWDRKNTIHIQAGSQWQGKLSGLCGNFDLKTVNEMKTPDNMDVSTPQEFGNSWTAAECIKSPDLRHPCALNPTRESFAKRQCGILLSEVFQTCHPVVDVTSYYMNCLADTCSCSRGGDCECFCSSLATYAHSCCQQGIPIDWRSPSLCPYDCEYYNKVLGKGPIRLLTYRERDLLLAANRTSGLVFLKRGVSSRDGLVTLFMITPGLSKTRPHDSSLVSFEAADRPNYFLLTERSGHLRLRKWEDSREFCDSATFIMHRDTWITGFDSLESLVWPGYFLHYMLYKLQLLKYNHSPRYRRATLFKLAGSTTDFLISPQCQWRYESCTSPCFRTCSDPAALSCVTTLKVEGCFPQCPADMVMDEMTQRCVYLDDCIKPPVTLAEFSLTPTAITSSTLATATIITVTSTEALNTTKSSPPEPRTTTSTTVTKHHSTLLSPPITTSTIPVPDDSMKTSTFHPKSLASTARSITLLTTTIFTPSETIRTMTTTPRVTQSVSISTNFSVPPSMDISTTSTKLLTGISTLPSILAFTTEATTETTPETFKVPFNTTSPEPATFSKTSTVRITIPPELSKTSTETKTFSAENFTLTKSLALDLSTSATTAHHSVPAPLQPLTVMLPTITPRYSTEFITAVSAFNTLKTTTVSSTREPLITHTKEKTIPTSSAVMKTSTTHIPMKPRESTQTLSFTAAYPLSKYPVTSKTISDIFNTTTQITTVPPMISAAEPVVTTATTTFQPISIPYTTHTSWSPGLLPIDETHTTTSWRMSPSTRGTTSTESISYQSIPNEFESTTKDVTLTKSLPVPTLTMHTKVLPSATAYNISTLPPLQILHTHKTTPITPMVSNGTVAKASSTESHLGPLSYSSSTYAHLSEKISTFTTQPSTTTSTLADEIIIKTTLQAYTPAVTVSPQTQVAGSASTSKTTEPRAPTTETVFTSYSPTVSSGTIHHKMETTHFFPHTEKFEIFTDKSLQSWLQPTSSPRMTSYTERPEAMITPNISTVPSTIHKTSKITMTTHFLPPVVTEKSKTITSTEKMLDTTVYLERAKTVSQTSSLSPLTFSTIPSTKTPLQKTENQTAVGPNATSVRTSTSTTVPTAPHDKTTVSARTISLTMSPSDWQLVDKMTSATHITTEELPSPDSSQTSSSALLITPTTLYTTRTKQWITPKEEFLHLTPSVLPTSSKDVSVIKVCTPPYSLVVDECTKLICVNGQLILFNKSQSCPYDSSPPNCGLLGFAVLVNGDKCCPKWDCPCRCSVFPDLNIVTFDGNSVALYKAAAYVVTQLMNETVTILVQECLISDSTLVWNFTHLCLAALNITHDSKQVLVNRLQRRVYINSRYAMPRLKKDGFEVLDTGNMYLIRTPAGLKIQWFHSTGMMVIETETRADKASTMGLCGCCDGNSLNDLILANGTVVADAEDPAVFIDSWQIPNTTSYVGLSRRREANCSTSDCSDCLNMLHNLTFTACHSYVPPATFCEVWVRDAEYVNNRCVALAAYVASCHKFNICIEWRSQDYCPFVCPGKLQYQACLPACTALSCPNKEFEYDAVQCSGMSEGCMCPEGTLLHRPFSALCISPVKCACTDSFGSPRALGEVWKASVDGCCMYRCESDGIVPVEFECSDIPQPVCTRAGEISVSLADDNNCCTQRVCVCNQSACETTSMNCGFGQKMVLYFRQDSCCPQYTCECDPDQCVLDVPVCREDQTLIATRTEGSCCLAYICMCAICSEVIPECEDGELLTVEPNSTDRCCPIYHCLCETSRCSVITCPLGMVAVSNIVPKQCCPSQECKCACETISQPKCAMGENLQLNRAFIADSENPCGCKHFHCVRSAVCVDGYRGIMRPGQTLMEHSALGVCYTTRCTHSFDSATGFYLIKATSINCTAQCLPNQVYLPPKDQSACCGVCKNVSCMYHNDSGSLVLYKPGKSWVSDCMRYECADTQSGPVLVSYSYSCPPFNETECMKIGGTVMTYMDGCCKTCTGQSIFPFLVNTLKPTTSTNCDRGKEDGKSCQKVTVRMTIRKNDCRSNRPVNIVSCDGKCPSASIYNYNINTYARFCKCCREMGLQRRSVQLYCSGNSTWVNYSIQEPTDCSCQWS